VAHRRGDPDPHRRDGRVGRLTRGIDLAALLTTSGAAAKRHHSSLRRHGFAAPAAALTNLHALTPTPRDCELLAPVFPRLLAEAWRLADATLRAQYGAPLDAGGAETGLAVIGMGKLGGDELNYSSDIDLMFVYGADGETEGGSEGRIANGDYFARLGREIVA